MANFITAEEAVAEIQDNVATIRGAPADEVTALYAKRAVGFVLDYCNREDFPETLALALTDLLGRWLDDAESGGRQALKSIKQNDTEYQFGSSEAQTTGSQIAADLEALKPQLNRYRKLRWPE